MKRTLRWIQDWADEAICCIVATICWVEAEACWVAPDASSAMPATSSTDFTTCPAPDDISRLDADICWSIAETS